MCASLSELEGEDGLETVVLPIESLILCVAINQSMIASYSKIKKRIKLAFSKPIIQRQSLLLETSKAKTVSITEYL